jgi:hypothetical protein
MRFGLCIVFEKLIGNVASEIVTVVTMKSAIFWDVTPYSPIAVNSSNNAYVRACPRRQFNQAHLEICAAGR